MLVRIRLQLALTPNGGDFRRTPPLVRTMVLPHDSPSRDEAKFVFLPYLINRLANKERTLHPLNMHGPPCGDFHGDYAHSKRCASYLPCKAGIVHDTIGVISISPSGVKQSWTRERKSAVTNFARSGNGGRPCACHGNKSNFRPHPCVLPTCSTRTSTAALMAEADPAPSASHLLTCCTYHSVLSIFTVFV